jgi:hypothetical protein
MIKQKFDDKLDRRAVTLPDGQTKYRRHPQDACDIFYL